MVKKPKPRVPTDAEIREAHKRARMRAELGAQDPPYLFAGRCILCGLPAMKDSEFCIAHADIGGQR